mmetsp:Transcript_18121/g.50717  ORF Transcript_18121/g.50717 Transcript_18121/m.50717 type:complete len:424 (-) Transcript_18121:1423-2694(-)
MLKPSADDSMREMLEREMIIGRLLYQALGTYDSSGTPTIPGYMMIQAVVREGSTSGKLLGIIIEKINSMDVFKRIEECGHSNPVNIHYIREMLFQTLTALKAGQEAIGFYHRDLHASNIMEHIPQGHLQATIPGPKASESSSFSKSRDIKLAARSWNYRVPSKDDLREELQKGTNRNIGIEFKIIDFGWAVAEAVDEEDVNQLMKEGAPTAIGCGRCFCCMVKPPPPPAKIPSQSSAANRAGTAPDKSDRGRERFKGSKIPKLGFSSMLYHRVWRGSSDCWRLLSSVAAIVDGRLWHSRDKEDVLQLADLVFKASGVRIRIRFTDDNSVGSKYGRGWQARQIMRMRGWFNMGWSMAFPSDPGFSIDSALEHSFLQSRQAQANRQAAAAAALQPISETNSRPHGRDFAGADAGEVELSMQPAAS